MTYPADALPTDRTLATPATEHPDDHNNANGAINDIIIELGSGPKGSYDDVTSRLSTMETLLDGHSSRHASDGDDPLSYLDIDAAYVDHTHEDTQVTLADNYQEITGTKEFIKEQESYRVIDIGVDGEDESRLHINADGSLTWLNGGQIVGKFAASSTGVEFNPFTAPTLPTYSRTAAAYKRDGTLVTANTPIYEPSNFDNGVLIEEPTTNLLPLSESQTLSTPYTTGILNGTYTISVYSGGNITISGGASGVVTPSAPLTISVSSATITLTPSAACTRTQVENKSYKTTWQIGGTPRQRPIFTIPTDVINPLQGTVDIWFQISETAMSAIDNARLFHIPTTGDYGIYVKHTGTGWDFNIYNESGIGNTSASALDTDVDNGWRLFTLTWDSSVANFYIDGELVSSISTPSLPTAFTSNMFIGNWSQVVSDVYINTVFDDIRISNVVRPVEEIAEYFARATTLPNDENTVYKLGLDESLSTGNSTSLTIGSIEYENNTKLGLNGASPVAQHVAIADATGGGTVDTQARSALNTLLAYLRTRGDIAS